MGGFIVILLMIVGVTIRYARESSQKQQQAQEKRSAQGSQPQPRRQNSPRSPGRPDIPQIPGIPTIPILELLDMEEEGQAGEKALNAEGAERAAASVAGSDSASGRATGGAYSVGGEAGRYTVREAQWGSLGGDDNEGTGYSGEGSGTEGEEAEEHDLHLWRMRMADDAEEAYMTASDEGYAPEIRLDHERVLNAIIYAEILSKPKALRNRR